MIYLIKTHLYVDCKNLFYYSVVFSLLQPVQVNLNHMICPAVRDPFRGPHYRKAAVIHQAILCPLMCKSLCAISKIFFYKDEGKNKSAHHNE